MPDTKNTNKWEEALQEALQKDNMGEAFKSSPVTETLDEDQWTAATQNSPVTETLDEDQWTAATQNSPVTETLDEDQWEEPLPSVTWEESPEEAKWRETDLYRPLKSWLESTGFTVHGEVKHCDVAACRDGELTLIEIKRTVNLELLLQLVRRQEAADTVYAAVLAPPSITRRWKELTRLLKRLEVGLILIHMDRPQPLVQVAFHPIRQAPRINKGATKALLTEMEGRDQDLNTGGSNRVKLFTAYRLQALDIAHILQRLDTASPRQLTVEGSPSKTGNILRANHYGWFERVARGMYKLTSEGEKALVEYQHIFEQKKGS